MFVLDCSITVAWLFDDESTPQTDELLDRLKDSGALVPALWRLELGNVLARAERLKRITAAHIADYLDLLDRSPIVTDTETESRTFREILTLARNEGLTTFDVAYLELAVRRRLPLATLDRELIRAAHRVQVGTLPV